MKERFFDLNGRENCVTAEIKVADMTFRISRVVTGVRVRYANHLKEMGSMLRKLSEFDLSTPEGVDSATSFTETVDKFAQEKAAVYDDLLSNILTKNGYSYDKAWWQENTDEFDVRAFVESCLCKDAVDQKKK
ncbi:hypothetical protein [uncultured Sphaerochaeta sp.]|uniref:hypothetical protein n=1 Tax=uncultured Sphaerochaeta sp. TaxID=886478 RepID=UPI002A0A47DD|nr:hypothetical protein [uncultured Sphaerochaeta sp.]